MNILRNYIFVISGGNLFWRRQKDDDEDDIQVLQKELKAKEDTIEVLRLRLSTVEREGTKLEREFDILKQSLRILNATKDQCHRRKLSSNYQEHQRRRQPAGNSNV